MEHNEYSKLSAPIVFNYINLFSFLQDWYAYKKLGNSGFSYSTWAQKIGYSNRSNLRLMVMGKRPLSLQHLEMFLRGFRFAKKEKDYFENLFLFSQARSLEAREQYLKTLMKVARQQREVIGDSYLFLSNHYTTKILSLVTWPHEVWTTENIQQKLNAPIGEIRDALEALSKVGVIRQEGTKWITSSKHLALNNDFGNLAIQSFHAKSLDEAKKAISLPPSERSFQTLFTFLSAADYAEVNTELDVFLESLIKRFQNRSSAPHDCKLYQVNFNLIPVSQTLPRPKEDAIKPTTLTFKEKDL